MFTSTRCNKTRHVACPQTFLRFNFQSFLFSQSPKTSCLYLLLTHSFSLYSSLTIYSFLNRSLKVRNSNEFPRKTLYAVAIILKCVRYIHRVNYFFNKNIYLNMKYYNELNYIIILFDT